jgi:hypothetical protein
VYDGRRKKPFAFIEFLNYKDAQDAKEDWDRREFQGRVYIYIYVRPSMGLLLLVYRLKYFSPPTDVRQHQAVSSKWSLPSRSVSALLKAPFADGQTPLLLPISYSHAAKSWEKWMLTPDSHMATE